MTLDACLSALRLARAGKIKADNPEGRCRISRIQMIARMIGCARTKNTAGRSTRSSDCEDASAPRLIWLVADYINREWSDGRFEYHSSVLLFVYRIIDLSLPCRSPYQSLSVLGEARRRDDAADVRELVFSDSPAAGKF